MLLRLVHFGCLTGTLLLTTACHTYVPNSAAPASGTEVAVVLTDKGRAALADRVGPEMDELRGRLMSSTDSSVIISMTQSLTLRGVSATWTDEVLTVSREHFGSLRTKVLSRGRTSVLAGVAGASAVFLVLTRGILTDPERVTSEPSIPPPGTGRISRVGTFSIPFRSDF